MTRSLSFTALSIGIAGLIIGYSVTLVMRGGIASAGTPYCPKAAAAMATARNIARTESATKPVPDALHE